MTLKTEVESGASGYSVRGGEDQGIFVKQVLKDSSAARLFNLREGTTTVPSLGPPLSTPGSEGKTEKPGGGGPPLQLRVTLWSWLRYFRLGQSAVPLFSACCWGAGAGHML